MEWQRLRIEAARLRAIKLMGKLDGDDIETIYLALALLLDAEADRLAAELPPIPRFGESP